MLRFTTKRSVARQWLVSSSTRKQSYSSNVSIGDSIHGYTVQKTLDVPKLNMTAIDMIHKESGARHLHVARDDTNKVFAVGFRTCPPDHSGLPHILEHTTLCGSHKFPVRDPFFKMLTRSLANYMNALTGVDYTFYPFATTNQSDFANLQQVYLDAVFNPLLREADFRQEGWRLEFDKVDNPNSNLVFKGVVYNEMKGQMSNPAYLFYIRFFQTIYPSLQFSGGDPAHITSLKYEDLCEFHASKYHPSNTVSFSYGNMDLSTVLKPVQSIIESTVAKRSLMSPKVPIPQPIDLAETMTVEIEGPEDPTFDPANQYKVSLSWIVGEASDLEESIAWKVLGTLLTDGHSSPFYKALIDTGIASDFSVNTGLEETPAKNIFTIGVQGLSKESVKDFKSAVFQVFDDVAKNGIEKDRLDAVLNQAELADREVDANFGMDVVSRLFPRVFNSSNYLDMLDNEKLLANFRSHIAREPELFQNLVKSRLVGRPYLEFAMAPSKNFEAQLAKEESLRLESKTTGLTDDDKFEIFNQGLELQKAQQAEENLSTLPTLAANDISKSIKHIDVKKRELGANLAYVRESGTQGISYVSMLRNLANVPADLRSYLPLFASAVTNVGTTDMPMSELESQIKLNTGGVSTSLLVRSSNLESSDDVELHFSLGGSALEEKISHVYSLLYEMVKKADFSNLSKLKPLILATAQNALNSLSDSGHRYAMMNSKSSLTLKTNLDETLSGMDQMRFIIRMSKLSDGELQSQVVSKLKQIQSIITEKPGAFVAGLTSSESGVEENFSGLTDFVNKFPLQANGSISASTLKDLDVSSFYKTHFLLPFQVSYVGASVKGASYFDPDSAALQMLANLLTHRYLHKEVREKGGAYGGGASYSAMDGLFSFYSYRDPNPLNTIKTIKNSRNWALNYKWTDRDLEEAKLSVFQGVDAPISPRSEITYEYLYGLSNEMRQKRREALLAVTVEDVKRVADKYLGCLANLGSSEATVTVLGPPHPEFSAENNWRLVDPEGDL